MLQWHSNCSVQGDFQSKSIFSNGLIINISQWQMEICWGFPTYIHFGKIKYVLITCIRLDTTMYFEMLYWVVDKYYSFPLLHFKNYFLLQLFTGISSISIFLISEAAFDSSKPVFQDPVSSLPSSRMGDGPVWLLTFLTNHSDTLGWCHDIFSMPPVGGYLWPSPYWQAIPPQRANVRSSFRSKCSVWV